MAIGKEIISSTLAPAVYHRVPRVTVNFDSRIFQGVIASYFSKEARDQNAGALGSNEFAIHGAHFPFTDADKDAIRGLFDLADNQRLINAEFVYDGATVFAKAKVVKESTGAEAEENIQKAKSDIPVNFLQVAYEKLLSQAPFNEGATEV